MRKQTGNVLEIASGHVFHVRTGSEVSDGVAAVWYKQSERLSRVTLKESRGEFSRWGGTAVCVCVMGKKYLSCSSTHVSHHPACNTGLKDVSGGKVKDFLKSHLEIK